MKKIFAFIILICIILLTFSACEKANTVIMPTGEWMLVNTYIDSKNIDIQAVVSNGLSNIAKKETVFTFYKNGVFIERSKIGVLQSGSIAMNGADKITLDYNNVFTKGKFFQLNPNSFELQLLDGKVMVFEKSNTIADYK